MVAFLAVYRRKTLSDAELVGVTVRRDLVSEAVDAMLEDQRAGTATDDPITVALSSGRSRALELVREELNTST